MNKFKLALLFGVGVVTGIGVSAIYFKKKYEALYQEEVESFRRFNENAVSSLSPDYIKEHYGTENQEWVSDCENSEEYVEILSEKEYTGMTRKIGRNTEMISEYDFFETADDYDKVTLHYHYNDQTLVHEENDEPMSAAEVSDIIGNGVLDLFNEDGEDPAVLYVRNNKLKIDYEIIWVEASYSGPVFGFTDEERALEGDGDDDQE